ncbi:MAG: DNA mismatch repair endonuclease MutL, partial [Tetragenococcus halophilus]|nr:DNA mismatch repair endonuclease MutL [Tetragenococcus halophilus]
MSGKILELSERLTNQIAAGEVVERPASVVKELIENAIDANSTQINILLEEAGLKKIQVIDNGTGISPEDAESAFKRHATSKIHSRDDLFRIRTLGFRGEALPSIASVSEITFETATENASQGTYLYLKGGKIEENQPSVLRQGTKIIVENLFYNTPARLKYVKTLQTELAHIGDIVNRLALSHPNVAFHLVHEGNQMLSTSGNGDLKQTMAGIYGVQTAKKMREIQAQDLDFKIHGYVTLPEVTRATRNYLSTIVNGRYIKNFALNKAIVNGYGSKLMVGRFPIAVIEIEMDPLLVDVNVHPTKQEVRLSKEQELTTLLSKTINERLREENLIPNAAENLDFNKRVNEQEKAQQLSMDFEETKKNENKGLAYDKKTGDFYVNETADKPVENFVDKVGDKSGKVEGFYGNTSEEADISTFSSQENELDSENSSLETVEKEQAYPKKNAQES